MHVNRFDPSVLTRCGFALVSAGIIAATGCGSDPAVRSLDEQQLIESGVGVVAEGCSLVAQLGSGAVIGQTGRVVTVAHTVAGATSVFVVDADGTSHVAQVVAFDKNTDLAVLEVIGLDVPPLQIAPSTTGPGALLTWGRDEGVEFQPVDVTKRLDVTIEDIYTEEIVDRSGLELVGDIAPGDSGGPVLNADGMVIGIVYASSRDRSATGFATDADEITAVIATASDDGVANGRCF